MAYENLTDDLQHWCSYIAKTMTYTAFLKR